GLYIGGSDHIKRRGQRAITVVKLSEGNLHTLTLANTNTSPANTSQRDKRSDALQPDEGSGLSRRIRRDRESVESDRCFARIFGYDLITAGRQTGQIDRGH